MGTSLVKVPQVMYNTASDWLAVLTNDCTDTLYCPFTYNYQSSQSYAVIAGCSQTLSYSSSKVTGNCATDWTCLNNGFACTTGF